MTDDYYEEKVLEEIAPRGLKAGDPVGELPDPNATHHNNELSALAAAAAANASNKNDRGSGGGGGGIYRAGGPTTIFGGSGWGPYSDGPLNAARKSLLSRDGLGEENWMWTMAMRVAEAGEEWAKWRKEGVKAAGGVEAPGMGGAGGAVMGVMSAAGLSKGKQREMAQEEEEEEEAEAEDGAAAEPVAKKRKVAFESEDLPVGVYEPHSGVVHCGCSLL